MRTRVITPADVQTTFSLDLGWQPADVLAIAYSTEAVGAHVNTVRIGPQVWEALLDESVPDSEKAVVTISVASLPDPRSRTMYFRLRARELDTDTITRWSEPNSVRFIGKPGKPNQTK